MKHKVALILPYFGTLPNYFPLWLKSAGANRDFTFFLFTDDDCSRYNVPDNVKVIPMTLGGVKKLAAPHFDFDCVLETPYKLCDYKPMYGLIFQDWLKGYDFWGHVDPDIVWGKLGHFVTDDLLSKYSRLYSYGHFTLYRNTPEINSFVLHKLPYWSMSYKNIYRIEMYMCLDESALTEHLFSNFTVDGGQFYRPDFAAISLCHYHFRCYGYGKYMKSVPAFRWKNGELYGLSVNGESGNDTEYMYIHLEKRAMKLPPEIENEDSFMIIPNEFVKDHELTQEEITALMTPDPEYEAEARRKYKKIPFPVRVKNFLKASFRGKINRIERILRRRWNILTGHKLVSMWPYEHPDQY